MKYEFFKNEYDKLEKLVISALINEVQKSKTVSQHMETPAIKVNVFDYEELVIIDNRVVFLDNDGLHYNLYTECSLEDLVDILTNL